jgi:RNA polymerase sigma-32 factor
MTQALVLTEQGLNQYMAEVRKAPILSREQEVELARRYRQDGDLAAAHQLVLSNLRFVVKIAHEYKKYGFRLLDLIQEGNMGLMLSVKKFDPEKGYRLISYAVFWIRAQINSYIMRSWSLVKLGTGRARRKLFFKLRSEKAKALHDSPEHHASSEELADRLDVTALEVDEMEQRFAARDFSLDAQIGEGSTTHLDALASFEANQEELLGQAEASAELKNKVHEVLDGLNEKERFIVENRMMNQEPMTLQQIGDSFKVSRERVRQLESRIVAKLRDKLLPAATA